MILNQENQCFSHDNEKTILSSDTEFYHHVHFPVGCSKCFLLCSLIVVSADCDNDEQDPVCDTNGVQHANVCSLLARRGQLAYRGHCRTSCDFSTAVCGVDGETYKNECTALAENVAVDYFKPCSSVPAQKAGE